MQKNDCFEKRVEKIETHSTFQETRHGWFGSNRMTSKLVISNNPKNYSKKNTKFREKLGENSNTQIALFVLFRADKEMLSWNSGDSVLASNFISIIKH